MLDLDAILSPISDDQPTGENLRMVAGDTTFSQIEEMRLEMDPALDPDGQGRTADWKGVIAACDAALTERSKDLELAAFLTQGLVQRDGFAGLLDGLRITRALLEGFWATLHPGYDEGEIIEAIRARPISWLGASKDFLATVKQVPISDPIGDEARGWYDYEQSLRVDEAAVRADQTAYNEMIADGLINGEKWRGALAATPPERLQALHELLTSCSAEVSGLEASCEELFEEDAPYLLDLRNLLDDCATHVEQFLAGGSGVAVASAADGAGAGEDGAAREGATPGTGGAAPAGTGGPIASRDQAYRMLREVAQYLRRTEPHSPVAPLIDRAIRWGEMGFESLFEDVVKDETARFQVREILGIEVPEE